MSSSPTSCPCSPCFCQVGAPSVPQTCQVPLWRPPLCLAVPSPIPLIEGSFSNIGLSRNTPQRGCPVQPFYSTCKFPPQPAFQDFIYMFVFFFIVYCPSRLQDLRRQGKPCPVYCTVLVPGALRSLRDPLTKVVMVIT